MSADEITPGGSTIYRYANHRETFQPPEHQAEYCEELTDFLEGFLGSSGKVWHELVSDKVHIDVLQFSPTDGRPFWTFVTSGMSDLPMNVPDDVEPAADYRYAEMVISLPPGWFPEDESGKSVDFTEENFWPIALLKYLARFPHEYDTWLGNFHTVPNGDPAQPFADATLLSGAMLLPPLTWPEEKFTFQRSDGVAVNFLAVYPLYDDEMAIKLSEGAEAFLDLMEKSNLTEILDPTRRSLALVTRRLAEDGLFACPCCNARSLVDAGGHEICDVCGWEDDPEQEAQPDQAGGANRISLMEARENYRKTGNSDPDHHNRRPQLP